MNNKKTALRFTAVASSVIGALIAATALTACAPLLIGGAIAGGSMVAIDRRTSGAQVDDQTIEIKGSNRIKDTLGDKGSVSVTSYNRVVLLTGAVPNESEKASVEQAVTKIENVRSVVNEISVGFNPSFGNRSQDTLITGKVKASLVDAKDLQSNAFKVVTEKGVVYLMGRVTEREANRATEVARGVNGVTKVVRVFEVITETELADVQTRAPAAVPPKP
jgi:osmotically-inducible protein OsmY